jgi:hypothetical protein
MPLDKEHIANEVVENKVANIDVATFAFDTKSNNSNRDALLNRMEQG